MLSIGLFLLTNIAIMAVISITFSLLGFNGLMAQNGVDLDLNALLVYSAIIGFSGSLFSLFISKFMAKRSMGVQLIEQPSNRDEQWIIDTVAYQARRAGIGMPEVGIFHSQAPNAFATGWNKNNALVAVSTGLLQSMNRDEVEAVLAHEVSHVANGDMITLSLIQGVINTFVVFFSRIIGHFVDRVVFKTESGHGPAFWITSIIAELLLGILALVIVRWFSRFREYRADAGGADLAGKHKMIAALKALQRDHTEALPDEMAAFGISGGGTLQALIATHPSLDDRISALENAR